MLKESSTLLLQLLFEGRTKSQKKTTVHEEEKIIFHQDNAPCHKSIKTMAKLNKSGFNQFLHPPYSPNPASIDYWLFTDLKKMLQGKRYGSNEEVIIAIEAYFVAKDKSFYKHGIEKLESVGMIVSHLGSDYVDE